MAGAPPLTSSTDSGAPAIFDTALIKTRKHRALQAAGKAGARDGAFLLDTALEDVAERLDAVERMFQTALDLSDDDGRVAQRIAASQRVQAVTRLACDPLLARQGTQPVAIGTPETLPIVPASLDLVTSVLALQWINDLPGALVQIRRALKPDGLFLGAFVGGDTLRELRDVLAREEEEATGGASPKVAPFVDVRDFGSLLQRAGFALPVTDSDTYTVRYGNLFALMADLRAMGATNPLVRRSRRPWTKKRAVRAAQLYAESYAHKDGRIPATFHIISFSGWAPAASQPQPLKPGSARARLADALGTEERPTGDKAGG